MTSDEGAAASAGARAVARLSVLDAAPDWIPNPLYVESAKRAREGSLVTFRNNLHIASGTEKLFRVPRPYVAMCAKASLGVFYEGGRVVFKALMCGSWSCSHCRKVLAARMLDRLRRGLEARQKQLHLVTFTVSPLEHGARIVGKSLHDDGRETNLVSEPTLDQFRACAGKMSREFTKWVKRLNMRLERSGRARVAYFRVIELHRNGWPHYHVILEHSQLELLELHAVASSWTLGRVDVRPVSVDDAVGEVAPYLVCNEKKSGGHKAYQFAATALPKHFRLHSSSVDFLGATEAPEMVKPEHALVLRGHFSGYKKMLESFDADDVAWVCPPPVDQHHKPPGAVQAFGDGAVILFAELVHQDAVKALPTWFRPVLEVVSNQNSEKPNLTAMNVELPSNSEVRRQKPNLTAMNVELPLN